MIRRSRELSARLAPWLLHGPAATAAKLARRTLERFATWGTLVFMECDVSQAPPARAPEGFVARELTPADLGVIASAFKRDPQELAQRFSRGDQAFGLFDASSPLNLLNVRWVTRLPTLVPEAGLWICPRRGEVYLYDIVTHPLYRGNRLNTALRAWVDFELRSRGAVKKIGYVRAENYSMLKAVATQPGARELFRVGYVQTRGRGPLVIGRYEPPVHGAPFIAEPNPDAALALAQAARAAESVAAPVAAARPELTLTAHLPEPRVLPATR